MRKTIMLTIAWLTAAAVAVTVAWQGVSVVGDQVTDQRPTALAAADIEERREQLDDLRERISDDSARLDRLIQQRDALAAAATTSTTTQATRGTTPTTATASGSAAPSTTAASAAAETRTYNLQGGSAALRFTSSGVTVVFANPASGFTVEVEPEHVNGVKVEFRSETHRSRVDGWWSGGPVDRIREEPR